MKKLTCLFIVIAILISFTSLALASESTLNHETIILTPGSTRVMINNQSAVMQVAPYIEDGTTMIPIRFFSENILKATVQWDSSTNLVTIYDRNNTVIIDLHKNQVFHNHEEYELTVPPVVRNGYTFVPLRLIAELFDCVVHYNQADRTVTITSTLKPEILPVASLELPRNLVAGQKLSYQDNSYDPLGYSITDRIWEISKDGQTFRTKNLVSSMSKPSPGIYNISLRVKNSAGVWSDWVTQRLEVLPNKPPEIYDFTCSNMEPAIGEALEFSYKVKNEEWEEITEVRWSYSWFDGEKTQVRNEKPRAFFKEGSNKVLLQVKDEYGNWSEVAELELIVDEEVVMTEKAFKFSDPIHGEVFHNHENINYNLVPNAEILATSNDDVTLITSNNPEKVNATGILYYDEVSGRVMIRYHHRNMLPGNLKILAIAENNGDVPVELEILKRGLAGPSLDAMQVGQRVVISYLQGENVTPGKKITIQPGQRLVLNQNQRALKHDEILAGLIELNCSDKLQFTIVAMGENDNIANYKNLPILPKEGTHIRGTFQKAKINIDVLASGQETEKVIIGRYDAYPGYFLYGFENTTGEYMINNGNRGVPHTITITAEERIGVFLNPRGTIYRGALQGFVDNEITLLSNSGVLVNNQESVILGVIEKGETKTINYLPPSGSDSPVLLIFVPEDEW